MKTLKEIRSENHLTQSELAELFSVSSRTIQNIEKDSSNIRDPLLQKYMKAFDLCYDDIFLGKEYEIIVFEEGKRDKLLYSITNKLSSNNKEAV